MAAKKSTRATRSKQETAEAFEEVKEKVETTPAVPPAEVEVRQTREKEIRSFADGVSVEKSMQNITTAGLNITKTLSSIAEQLQAAAKEVEDLKKAKELYEKDIEALHGKEVATSAIEDLIANYKTKREELSTAFDAEAKKLAQDQKEMQEEWDKEKAAHDLDWSELDAAAQRNRQQENDQSNYQTQQRRSRAELEWQNKMADLSRANTLKQSELERGWADREGKLKAMEAEFTALKARVDGIPAEIDAAVKKAEAIVGNSVKRDYTHQIEMLQATHAAQHTVNLNTINSLQAQIKTLVETNAAMTTRLNASEEKVASIANEALKASSGRQALAEVQTMIQSQQNPGNNKRA